MSAHLILGLEQVPRVRRPAASLKEVRELGLERRETVRIISAVDEDRLAANLCASPAPRKAGHERYFASS